jgi:hypothetical protein
MLEPIAHYEREENLSIVKYEAKNPYLSGLKAPMT